MNNSDNLSHTDDDETQYNEISKLSSCNDLESVEKILNIVPPPRFGDITVNNSTNVVLGNIIKIKGDLIINVKKDDKLNGQGGGQKSANELRKTQDDKENSILKTTKTGLFHVKHLELPCSFMIFCCIILHFSNSLQSSMFYNIPCTVASYGT